MKKVLRVLFLGALCFAIVACWNWSKVDVAETKRRGDIVRNALKEYRTKTGTFPENLDALVPQYLSTIPRPTVGKRVWKYDMWADGRAYTISPALRSEHEPLLQGDQDPGWTYDTK